MKEDSRRRQRVRYMAIALFVVFSLSVLLAIEYIVMTGNNRVQAYRTASVLADQVENILETNARKETALIETLKENYISKAKAVAYIVDNIPGLDENISELIRIARLMSIDEIHLFDDTGTIYAGTVPIYYGYSFDSGEQMAFFKPMLENKSLSMCQDVTPNTAEGKSMMYAICWDDAGERMIQVGIEPVRLLEEMRTGKISEAVATLPAGEGIRIIVADGATGEVIGSTQPKQLGRSLRDIGIDTEPPELYSQLRLSADVDHDPSYVAMARTESYVIAVAQEKAEVNQNIPTILLTTLLYLLLAVAVICVIARRMTLHIIDEHRNATTDQLTGLLNRRAYEDDLKAMADDPRRKDLVYLALDLNGLKAANDTLGHEAGDELLVCASQYMKECFGEFGRLYRTGGDEFMALLFVDDAQLKLAEKIFAARLEAWTRRHGRELSVSWGCAKAREAPELSLMELGKLADNRMYEVKAEYYKSHVRDPRQ